MAVGFPGARPVEREPGSPGHRAQPRGSPAHRSGAAGRDPGSARDELVQPASGLPVRRMGDRPGRAARLASKPSPDETRPPPVTMDGGCSRLALQACRDLAPPRYRLRGPLSPGTGANRSLGMRRLIFGFPGGYELRWTNPGRESNRDARCGEFLSHPRRNWGKATATRGGTSKAQLASAWARRSGGLTRTGPPARQAGFRPPILRTGWELRLPVGRSFPSCRGAPAGRGPRERGWWQ